MGLVFVAVAGRPLLQLMLCPAAELQKLLPVPLKEIEYTGNTGILLRFDGAEGIPVDMDMEAAGSSLMAGIAHTLGSVQDRRPGHFLLVVSQGHGMGDDLKAVLQGAVMLAIDTLFAFLVGDFHDMVGVIIILSGSINLQLHAKEAGRFSVEDGLGLIVIVVDTCGPQSGKAFGAIGIIAVLVTSAIPGILISDKGATAHTGRIGILPAAFAKGCVSGSGVV